MTETTLTIHEERATNAREAAEKAREELRTLEEPRPMLAVAAFEGDEGAREDLAELDEQATEKRRVIGVCETAAAEAERVAEGLRRMAGEDRVRAEEVEKRARYDELADRREDLEISATSAILDLGSALDEIKALDAEQRAAAREAGVHDALNKVPLYVTTNSWIAAHLREHAPDLAFRPEFYKPLNEISPLPRWAPAPEEVKSLHATREREHAEQRAAEHQARETVEQAKAFRDRRAELLALTEHASSTPSRQRDIEREVNAKLAKEFEGYSPPRMQVGYEGPDGG